MSTEVAVPTIAPGLYKGMSYDDYARIDAVRHTVLRHFNRTAAHAREFIEHPPQQTEAQALGHATHVAILEPDRFAVEFGVMEYMGDRRSSKVRAEEEAFRAKHSSMTFMAPEEHALCLKLRDAVWAHPTASELLKGKGFNEASAVWVDPETGLRCKERLDRLTTLGTASVVVDLKTTKNASRYSFSKAIHDLYYHQQAGMYLSGLEEVAPYPRKFMFIAVEKDPPHCVAVYELEDDAIEIGRDEFHKHLRMYAECVSTGVWPGYSAGADYVSIPSWAFRQTQGE